jgi:uncharacterized protein YdeI (YjbR/CyaY-like superfamily)
LCGIRARARKRRSPRTVVGGFAITVAMTPSDARSFATPALLDAWMKRHHETESELWVRIFKKDSGVESVSWDDCVLVSLVWGWIDGQRRSLDEESYLQRLTPRRARSSWSQRNCAHAERLIAEGKMQPAGLAHVEAARADGRWESAYAGPAAMVIPEDFLSAIEGDAAAKAFYATLDRKNLYAIYHRLHTAKRPETRAKRVAAMVAQLARRERFH